MAKTEIPSIDFRAVFEAAPVSCLLLRPDLTIVAVSNAYLDATMTRRDSILGRGIFEVFPNSTDDSDATGVHNLSASLERVLRDRRSDTMAVQRYVLRRPESEGGGFEERYWSLVNAPVLDSSGEVLWIIHRVEDVTEFVHLTQLDGRQEQEARDLRQDSERMGAEILRRAQELQENNRTLRQGEKSLRQINEALEQRLRERTEQLEVQREHERTQDALRESQKLEAIGRLAGGVAHDFNNLLTVILGNAEVLRDSRLAGPEARIVDAIDRAATAGARLTRQLLAFSRRQALRPERIDLRERTEEITELLARSLRGDIRVVVTLAENLWPIECDLGELELALLNICVNARDAMPEGGLVRIDGRNARLSKQVGDPLDGDFVTVTVTDSGTGIAPDILPRVFDPFFTTKDIGKGTGLGLSQVLGFAQQAGGTATITSQMGHGTSVALHLPRASTTASASPAQARPPAERGSGTVLIVEDDEEVAATAERILDLIGYRAHHVRDSRTALTILLGGNRFDLVFADIIMPGGMSGLELARKIRMHFPKLPVLLASGYSQAAAEVARENLPIIAKPYRADALAEAIRQCLAQSKQSGDRDAC